MIYHMFLLVVFLLVSLPAYAFDHDYRKYGEVLQTYVKDGLVDYVQLQKNRTTIDSFVKELAGVRKEEYDTWTREKQLAFWINGYNGWFLKIVIDHYPIRGGKLLGIFYPENSVQRIPGVWDVVKTQMAGREVSLNTIEHRILRTIFKEPRIHFSIVCASLGCPVLRTEPFRANELESQLEAATRDFINNPSKVRWNQNTNRLEVSKIFDWFASDFRSAGGVVSFIKRYASKELAEKITPDKKVAYLEYDWRLNERKARAG
jgi:Protein of unknown function, DUF547